MNKKILTLTCCFLMFCFTRCATIFNGTTQEITIKSDPKTKIYVDGVYKSTGNVVVNLKRKKSHKIVGIKDGYQPKIVLLKHKDDYAMFALNTFNLWQGTWIDLITGAYWKFDEDTINFSLEPEIKATN